MILDDVDFWRDVYAELVVHVFADSLAECHDVVARCAALVDQNESLFGVDPCSSECLAFPAALVYHPSGWYLFVLCIYVVVGHLRVVCQ